MKVIEIHRWDPMWPSPKDTASVRQPGMREDCLYYVPAIVPECTPDVILHYWNSVTNCLMTIAIPYAMVVETVDKPVEVKQAGITEEFALRLVTVAASKVKGCQSMKEANLNKKIQDLIEKEGGYVVKTIATNRAGVPDILACLQGKFLAIEGKTSTGVVSELQRIHLEQIRKAQGIAIVARSLDEVKQVIASIKASQS